MSIRSLFIRVKIRKCLHLARGLGCVHCTWPRHGTQAATLCDVSEPRWLPGSKHSLSTYYVPVPVLGDVSGCETDTLELTFCLGPEMAPVVFGS